MQTTEKNKNWKFNLLLSLFSIFITLLFLEVILRVVPPYDVDMRIYMFNKKPISDFYELDPVLGWNMKKDIEFRFKNKEFDTQVKMNGQGYRDTEFTEKAEDGKARIAFIGDSFTFGYGVERDESFVNLIENRFNDRAEILNFGVSGYSTLQELLLLKERAISYKPEISVLVYFANDVIDNVRKDIGPFIKKRKRGVYC